MVSLISNRNEKLSFKIILRENETADKNMNMTAGICHQSTKTDRQQTEHKDSDRF